MRSMNPVQSVMMHFTGVVLVGCFLVASLVPPAIAQDDGQGRRGRRGSEEERLEQNSRRGDSGRGGRGEQGQRQGGRRGGGKMPASAFQAAVPVRILDTILGRPTGTSVTARVLPFIDLRCHLVFGRTADALERKTATQDLSTGQPADFVMEDLEPDTRYFYRIIPESRIGSDSPDVSALFAVRSFQTWRRPGSGFSFSITADSHLDERTDTALYGQTMRNALVAFPDFHIDLGDTFMNDKKEESRSGLLEQYLGQRYYFGLLGHSTPVFLVVGNHDGESIRENDGTKDSLAVWSNAMRKRYFPNPEPDGFFQGNATPDPHAGLLQNYFAWSWGDALFVVLDPYWYSERQRGGDDNWKRSLGEAQYRWLKALLAKTPSRFTFVFIHQLVGGLEKPGRGGAAAAGLFEWGGRDLDGTMRFAERRPGWGDPIHQLLKARGGVIVFHGHDHLYVREELDGVVYQEVPQPGFGGRFDPWKAKEAGYSAEDALGGAGFLRVIVATGAARVEFIQTGKTDGGTVARSYAIAGRADQR